MGRVGRIKSVRCIGEFEVREQEMWEMCGEDGERKERWMHGKY